ncbi:MAG: hypothetical protein NZL85_10075 [Fimbriimonadales bacterium]|nr:hypothetical protein [Fimbriimonadales bacterium]
MPDWNTIGEQAERVVRELTRLQVDLNEAEKLVDYYLFKGCDDEAMSRYLDTLAQDPPPRSRRSQHHFRNLRDIWNRWNTPLTGVDKARAWGWAVRLAKAERQGIRR